MTIEDLKHMKEHVYTLCVGLSCGKSNDYADHEDVLLNFRRGGALFGMAMSLVIKTRLADKMSRLHQLTTGKRAMVSESVLDTLADAHNYLDLWYVALMEENPAAFDCPFEPDGDPPRPLRISEP